MAELRTDYHCLRGLCAVLFATVLIALSVYALYTPPAAKPVTAPDTSFSAARAFKIVEAIAQRPHPVGSAENARVRDHLLAHVKEMGLEPVLDNGLLYDNGSSIGNAESIYARIKGSGSTGAIMITGHYDSVPYGPGAADDCAGVASVLESARAILAGPPLKNDIIIHLSDGEEGGLLGAKSFLNHGPWREDLKLVVNFEARGHRGPSLMFQTSDDNGRLIKEYIECAPYPVASSVMFDIARLMPTTTDYWVYKKAGIPGFDFAFVGGLQYYHTMNDSPEYLSQRTLQGHGENCLALASHMGNEDLADLRSDNLVYFNTFGHHMVSYPASWVWPLTYAAVLFFLLTLLVGFLRGVLRMGSLFSSVMWFLLALVLVPLLVFAPVVLGLRAFGPYALYNQTWFVWGFVFLTAGIFLAVYAFASRRARLESLWAGALVILSILMVLQTRILPLGGYLFLWPFIFSTLGLLFSILTTQHNCPRRRLGIVLLTIAPACILLAPQIPIMFDTLTLVLGSVVMLIGAQLLGHLVPVLCHATAPKRWLAPTVSLAVSIPLFAVGILNTTFDASRPKMNYLAYGMNRDTQDACWVSPTDQKNLDVWLENFFANGGVEGGFDEYDVGNNTRYLRAAAPMADMENAQITVVKNELRGNRRHLSFDVRPAYETAGFELFVPARVAVYGGAVNGHKMSGDSHRPLSSWYLHYKGRCEQGIVVDLEVNADEHDPALTLIEYSFGLPAIESDPVPPRPDWMIPQTNTMPQTDFSPETVKSLNLFRMLQFSYRNLSARKYVRQTFTFPQTTAEAPVADETPQAEV